MAYRLIEANLLSYLYYYPSCDAIRLYLKLNRIFQGKIRFFQNFFITSFGVFDVRGRSARKGRIPNTGDTITTEA